MRRFPRIGWVVARVRPAIALIVAHTAPAEWSVVDPFESHPAGPLGPDPAPWIVESGPDAFRIAPHDRPVPGKHLEITPLRDLTGSLRHRDFSLPATPGAVATLFGRIQFSGQPAQRAFVHLLLGRAGDAERPERAFEWRLSVVGELPKLGIHRSVGHGTRELIAEARPDTWLSFWAVLRNSERVYSLYLAPGDGPRAEPQHLLVDRAALRSNTPIEVFRILAGKTPRGATVRIDDLYIDRTGENLTRPAPATAPVVSSPRAAGNPGTPLTSPSPPPTR